MGSQIDIVETGMSGLRLVFFKTRVCHESVDAARFLHVFLSI